MELSVIPVCLGIIVVLLQEGGAQNGQGPMHNNVQVCTADTSGYVRRGIFLRRRGDCQQGFVCFGDNIIPYSRPCQEPSYMSVHTGTCSIPNTYAYVFGSFNCSAEEQDENLDYDKLKGKRDDLCRPLHARADPETTELYVGDPANCRMMFKCPLVAEHDDWLHMCPVGTRFQEGDEGPCVFDETGCEQQRRG